MSEEGYREMVAWLDEQGFRLTGMGFGKKPGDEPFNVWTRGPMRVHLGHGGGEIQLATVVNDEVETQSVAATSEPDVSWRERNLRTDSQESG